MPTRLVAALLAAALVVTACGSDTGPDVASDPTTSTPAAQAGTPDSVPGAAGEAPATTVGDGDPVAGTETTVGGGGDAAAGAATTVPGEAAPTQVPPPSPGTVGSLAGYYLRPAESASVLIEVLTQDGAAPRPATIDHARSVLAAVSGKDVAVTTGSLDGGARQWTAAEIRSLADAAGAAQSRDRAVLRILYLRGGFAESEQSVGVAVRGDVAAVFADRVSEAAGVLGDVGAVEDAVTIHEIGHLLGLVDLVLATGREDPEHPGHSPNRDSVMYYAVESTLVGTLLSGGPPREFDQADRSDLAAIRGG